MHMICVRAGAAAAVALCVALTGAREGARAAENGEAPWFGASESDFAMMAAFAGKALRVKARFVEMAGAPQGGAPRKGKTPSGPRGFTVATAGGELACEADARTKGGEALDGMAKGTPLVIEGTLDAGRQVFLVRKASQSWGRGPLNGKGGS